MSKIIINNLNDHVVETYDSHKTVFSILRDNSIDWMHAVQKDAVPHAR